jgi:hypothetical protein
LKKIEKEVSEYQRFRSLCRKLVKVNDEICQARPVSVESTDEEVNGVKKTSRRSSRKRSLGR